jgi:hypothetical protein
MEKCLLNSVFWECMNSINVLHCNARFEQMLNPDLLMHMDCG